MSNHKPRRKHCGICHKYSEECICRCERCGLIPEKCVCPKDFSLNRGGADRFIVKKDPKERWEIVISEGEAKNYFKPVLAINLTQKTTRDSLADAVNYALRFNKRMKRFYGEWSNLEVYFKESARWLAESFSNGIAEENIELIKSAGESLRRFEDKSSWFNPSSLDFLRIFLELDFGIMTGAPALETEVLGKFFESTNLRITKGLKWKLVAEWLNTRIEYLLQVYLRDAYKKVSEVKISEILAALKTLPQFRKLLARSSGNELGHARDTIRALKTKGGQEEVIAEQLREALIDINKGIKPAPFFTNKWVQKTIGEEWPRKINKTFL